MDIDNNQFKSYCEMFMHVYMYELEEYLKENKSMLSSISFHSDEANTDKPLKEVVKSIILGRKTLTEQAGYNELVIASENVQIECTQIAKITIKEVYLPDEIPNSIRNILNKTCDAVYTSPDLLLVLSDGFNDQYYPIELKSTKNDKIPGSSIQQINPYQWVIFIKHSDKKYDITVGQYVNSINSNLQFPDRSPRPQVAFYELKNWNKKNRNISDNALIYNCDSEGLHTKLEFLNDWQNFLAERWIKVVFSTETRKREPWFNNNLRKFVIKFIDKYQSMSEAERKQYIHCIKAKVK